MDIEEDIKIVKEFNQRNRFRDCGRINNAIDNLLAEREEDKKEIEKLKEEVETHTYLIFTPIEEVLKDYIPKQKIKNKIKELENTKGDFATYIAVSERIKILKEVLEDK